MVFLQEEFSPWFGLFKQTPALWSAKMFLVVSIQCEQSGAKNAANVSSFTDFFMGLIQ